MNKLAFSAALPLILMTPAFAADLPSRVAPPVYIPPPLPVFSWTGFYAGVQGGYAFGKNTTNATTTTTTTTTTTRRSPAGGEGGGGVAQRAVANPATVLFHQRTETGLASFSSDPSGVVGGGHIGYNFSSAQLLGGVLGPAGVFGIEGDVEGLDDSKSVYVGTAFSRVKSDIQGSIRGRIGIAFDRLLIYGTGGAAFGDFKSTYGLNNLAFQSFDTTRVGYTVGGGIEYAFTNNLSLRAEYRYSDYGSFNNTIAIAAATVVVQHRETNQRIEGGISYLFTTPSAPAVIARY